MRTDTADSVAGGENGSGAYLHGREDPAPVVDPVPAPVEREFEPASARSAVVQIAGSALASMGVAEPAGQLLESLARVIVDLIR